MLKIKQYAPLGKKVMLAADQSNAPATAEQILHTLGYISAQEMKDILRTGANIDEIIIAANWLDDAAYLGAVLAKPMTHRAREVYEILKAHQELDDQYIF